MCFYTPLTTMIISLLLLISLALDVGGLVGWLVSYTTPIFSGIEGA
jgi:hypothetical protein